MSEGDQYQNITESGQPNRENFDKNYQDNQEKSTKSFKRNSYSQPQNFASAYSEDSYSYTEALLGKQEQKPSKKYTFDSLTTSMIWGYSVGHFFNDLCASIWFNYLLFFLVTIKQLKYLAPYILFVGQVCDAIATPLVGYLSDKTNSKWGKRTPWYIGGTLVVFISFLPIYLPYFLPSDASRTLKAVYFIGFPAIINLGWACAQIAHMSLVPQITCSRETRDVLNGRRNTFTFIANLSILITSIVGLSTCGFFLYTIREVMLTNNCGVYAQDLKNKLQSMLKNENTESKVSQEELEGNFKLLIQIEKPVEVILTKISFWFKQPLFYQCGIIYMGARLYCNIIATMTNFYLVRVLEFATEDQLQYKMPIQVALVPLILYISSVIFSSFTEYLFQRLGRKITFSIGFVFAILTSILLALLNEEYKWGIYPVAFFIGGAQALVLNTGMTLISEVIGVRGNQGAIVFGCYSFLDKLGSGIVLFIITILPQFTQKNFTRWVTVLVPISAWFLAFICVLFQKTKDVGKNDKNKKNFRNSLERELAQ